MDDILLKRRNSLPVIYVRGTFYDVGFDIGRTFAGLIKKLMNAHPTLNEVYIPLYETTVGKEIYDRAFQVVTKYYPHYIRELQGTADGAEVPFYKLFLLHLDDVLPNCAAKVMPISNGQGCSTLCYNEARLEKIGHTEDALKEVLNNIYIVRAHITESEPQEEFTAFCYAGLLPGYAMGFNKYGLAFSINIIGAKHLGKGRIPRSFVSRALLTADSLLSVEKILRCTGCGIADAMSVNLTFLNQPGDRLFHNIEVSPSNPLSDESSLSIFTISPGEFFFHTNRFLRLSIPEEDGPMFDSSLAREETKDAVLQKLDQSNKMDLLGDTSHQVYNIFRSTKNDKVWTVAVGIFDCIDRTWSIYLDNPKTCDPILVLPLNY